jgi:hypothetical protein
MQELLDAVAKAYATYRNRHGKKLKPGPYPSSRRILLDPGLEA